MSDDRLFASNNPIRRLWYFINLVILSGITAGLYYGITKLLIPNMVKEDYIWIANFILYFGLFICAITFFSLIDRRLYDISGSRDKGLYKTLSPIFTCVIFAEIVIGIFNVFPVIKIAETQISLPLEICNPIAKVLGYVLIAMLIFIGCKRGKRTKQ